MKSLEFSDQEPRTPVEWLEYGFNWKTVEYRTAFRQSTSRGMVEIINDRSPIASRGERRPAAKAIYAYHAQSEICETCWLDAGMIMYVDDKWHKDYPDRCKGRSPINQWVAYWLGDDRDG